MGDSNVHLALEELRHEYADVGCEVERTRDHLAGLESRLSRLRDAIESLERLGEPTLAGSNRADVQPSSTEGLEPKVIRIWGGDGTRGVSAEPDDETDKTALVPEKSTVAKYVARGGEGSRLRSTTMVADLVNDLDRVVTREELKVSFFERFPREELERFWDRPENAFSNALARAVKDKLIVRAEKSSGVEVFASHEVVRRLREKKATKSGPTAEEG